MFPKCLNRNKKKTDNWFKRMQKCIDYTGEDFEKHQNHFQLQLTVFSYKTQNKKCAPPISQSTISQTINKHSDLHRFNCLLSVESMKVISKMIVNNKIAFNIFYNTYLLYISHVQLKKLENFLKLEKQYQLLSH